MWNKTIQLCVVGIVTMCSYSEISTWASTLKTWPWPRRFGLV